MEVRQKLKPQKRGSLVAEFDLGDTEEIKRWVMSFGRHAEVLEPEGLRTGIAVEMRTTLIQYVDADRREGSSQMDKAH